MAERGVRTGKQMNLKGISRIAASVMLLALALSLASCIVEKDAAKDTAPLTAATVRSELLAMMDSEQLARDVLDSVVAESGWNSPEGKAAAAEETRIDSTNQIRLKAFVTEFGWPGRSLVGDEATLAAFLILQHADLALQEEYLPLFEAATEKGEVAPYHLAMLRDRILRRQDEPQIYGTQLWNDPSTGDLGLYTIRDSANVDVRRDSVGLGPIDDYLRSLGIDPDTMTIESPIEIRIGGGEDEDSSD